MAEGASARSFADRVAHLRGGAGRVLRPPVRRSAGRAQRPGRLGDRGRTARAGTVSRLTPEFERRRSGTLRTPLHALKALRASESATVCWTPAMRPCQGSYRPAWLLVG